jgi:hypothetical protein
MGVDVARGNADRCCIVITIDNRVVHAEAFHTQDTMVVVHKVEQLGPRFGVPWNNVHVDVIGVGAGVVDRLREKNRPVDAVNFGVPALGDQINLIGREVAVANRRAELYWAARCALNEGKAIVPVEYRRTIWTEGNLIQYQIMPNGRIKIEDKDHIRARYEGQSPDFADAWVLTFSRIASRRFLFVA